MSPFSVRVICKYMNFNNDVKAKKGFKIFARHPLRFMICIFDFRGHIFVKRKLGFALNFEG